MIKTLINIKQTIMKKNLFIIAFSLLASASGFAQQTCATAQIITANTFAFPTINGTEVPTLFCSTGGSGATAANWYKYTPTQDFAVTVTTDFVTNGNIDNRVQIYSGSCGALICVAGDDDDCAADDAGDDAGDDDATS